MRVTNRPGQLAPGQAGLIVEIVDTDMSDDDTIGDDRRPVVVVERYAPGPPEDEIERLRQELAQKGLTLEIN